MEDRDTGQHVWRRGPTLRHDSLLALEAMLDRAHLRALVLESYPHPILSSFGAAEMAEDRGQPPLHSSLKLLFWLFVAAFSQALVAAFGVLSR